MSDTEPMKRCIKCGAMRPLSDFYKHKAMKDGHLNKCKECTKKDVKENRENNLEYYKEYDRIRDQSEERKEMKRRYQQTEAGKESIKKSHKKWIENNRKKRNAQIKVGNAIRDGKLIKQPCEICGNAEKVVAHHCDYDKPLEVMWLCPKCHTAWHKENGEAANG